MGVSAESIQNKAKNNDDALNGHENVVNGEKDQDEEDEEEDTTSALSLIGLHRAAYKFLQGCGIYDLTLMDIMRPDPYKTRRILSAVVNFARFREEHSAECEALVLESESSLENVRKVQADNANIANQLNQLKTKIESDGNQKKATLKQVTSYNLKLEAELKKLKKAQEIVTLEHTQYKEEKARLIEKLDDIQYLVFESTKELDRLKLYSQTDVIVLQKIINDLKSQSNDLQATYNTLTSRDSNISITIDSIQSIENELKNLFRILEEISHDISKERDALSRLNDSQEYLEQLKLQSNDLARQIQQIQRQLTNMQEKTTKLKVQADERISKSQQQLASYRNDYTKLVEERNLKEEEYTKKKELISEIESSISKKKLEYQMEVRNTELKVTRLNAQIRLYLEEVGKKV
ncbi:uncharacterized protein CANTADRAFT_73554, partial [Suhomyces tanzawaensis NRRL Y-17324]